MNIQKTMTVSALAVLLAIPGLVSATSLWHESNGEGGATFRPDHIKSTKSRAEGLQELAAARKDGSLWLLQRSLPVPVKKTGTGKTREEVRKETSNLSVEELRQVKMIGGN